MHSPFTQHSSNWLPKTTLPRRNSAVDLNNKQWLSLSYLMTDSPEDWQNDNILLMRKLRLEMLSELFKVTG